MTCPNCGAATSFMVPLPCGQCPPIVSISTAIPTPIPSPLGEVVEPASLTLLLSPLSRPGALLHAYPPCWAN